MEISQIICLFNMSLAIGILVYLLATSERVNRFIDKVKDQDYEQR